ncbi:MAG: hypothetical protein CVV10_01155 [Gammaproteobacteria bacterium HGW-Gammaproteobacteria-14]|nr:MAG: hypothetical protein CVV10_01155 [Gammaproteobacteria bacterium HGW-Gammaproteobacteria-14]
MAKALNFPTFRLAAFLLLDQAQCRLLLREEQRFGNIEGIALQRHMGSVWAVLFSRLLIYTNSYQD